jgi:ethanolamine permease
LTLLGPLAGSLVGYFCMLEFLLASTQLLVACGSYITYVFRSDVQLEPVWWLILLAVAILLNLRLPAFYKATIFITILSCISLLVYLFAEVGKTGNFVNNLLLNPDSGKLDDLGKTDIVSVITSIPSAIWFYLGIEVLPTSAEETLNPRRDIQRGLISSMATLTFFAISILLVCTGTPPGAYQVAKAAYPLLNSLNINLLDIESPVGIALSMLLYSGLLASLLTLLFGFTRYFYALSRGGFLPVALSLTQKGNPIFALFLGSILIYAIALIIFLTPGQQVALFLLNASVMYALLSYVGSFIAFIGLRRKLPDLKRPFVSPLGIPGAVIGIIICLVAIVSCCIYTEIFRTVLWFIVAQTIVTVPYYIFYGRHAVRQTPERVFVKNQLKKVVEQDARRKMGLKLVHSGSNMSLMNEQSFTKAAEVIAGKKREK